MIEGAFFNTVDFELTVKKLGEGTYGTVYVARNNKDKQEYAAKILNIKDKFDGHEQMQFLKESLILYRLNHPSIVKFKGINFKSFRDPKLLEPSIITEYLPNGSLKDILNDERKSLAHSEWTFTKKHIVLLGICGAMRYLHEKNILHRDLKPENILIDSNFYPRVCDFGLSKCFPEALTKSLKLTRTGEFGTPLYLPPEVLRGDDVYDQSVDVYAFAMIAYEIVTGKEPFFDIKDDITGLQLMRRIIEGRRPKFTEFVSDKMRNLISKCWSNLPEDRPTFDQIFDELSNDFSYLNEKTSIEEIEYYLDILDESRDEEVFMMPKGNNIQLDELKGKINNYENERKIYFNSNNSLHDGLIFLFGNKKIHNIKKAINELEISSKKGNCYASLILGILYEYGNEIEQNLKESFKFYEDAFNQGNSSGYYRVGRFYNFGVGVEQDYSKAIYYYEKAAKLDDSNAFLNLGLHYKNGVGVEKNLAKAIELFEKASELGNSNAICNLGNLYQKGDVVERDSIKAINYFEQAANLGNVNALINLGIIYKNGTEVEQNYSKALNYFEKASNLDDDDAKKKFKDLKKKMKIK